MQLASRFDSAIHSLVITYPSLDRDRRALNVLFIFFELVFLGVLTRDLMWGSDLRSSILALEVVIAMHICWNVFTGLAVVARSQQPQSQPIAQTSRAIPSRWILLICLLTGFNALFFLGPELMEIVRAF
jgi:hypothetical protein